MAGKGCACSVQVQAFSLKYSIQLAEMQTLPLDTGCSALGEGVGPQQSWPWVGAC